MNRGFLGVLILITGMKIFAFSLDHIEFNESLKLKESKTKEYILTNNTSEIKKYTIKTSSNNVEIKPLTFILAPQKKEKINIKVVGEGKIGANDFFITISEKNLNKDNLGKNTINLNKIVQIKQHYFLK